MIKGVAFDLEGTVIDVEFAHFEAFGHAAESVGVCFDKNNLVEDIASKIPGAIGGGNLVNNTGIWKLSDKRVSVEEIAKRKLEFYNEIIDGLKMIELRPGFLEVFQRIRKLGLEVSIASLTLPNQAKVLFEKSGADELFPKDHILLADSVENLKPAPDVYLKAAGLMGIVPEQQLVFEDSPTGVMAAVAAKSRAVMAMPIYTFPHNIEELKEAGAHKIFYSWEDVDIAALLEEINTL